MAGAQLGASRLIPTGLSLEFWFSPSDARATAFHGLHPVHSRLTCFSARVFVGPECTWPWGHCPRRRGPGDRVQAGAALFDAAFSLLRGLFGRGLGEGRIFFPTRAKQRARLSSYATSTGVSAVSGVSRRGQDKKRESAPQGDGGRAGRPRCDPRDCQSAQARHHWFNTRVCVPSTCDCVHSLGVYGCVQTCVPRVGALLLTILYTWEQLFFPNLAPHGRAPDFSNPRPEPPPAPSHTTQPGATHFFLFFHRRFFRAARSVCTPSPFFFCTPSSEHSLRWLFWYLGDFSDEEEKFCKFRIGLVQGFINYRFMTWVEFERKGSVVSFLWTFRLGLDGV